MLEMISSCWICHTSPAGSSSTGRTIAGISGVGWEDPDTPSRSHDGEAGGRGSDWCGPSTPRSRRSGFRRCETRLGSESSDSVIPAERRKEQPTRQLVASHATTCSRGAWGSRSSRLSATSAHPAIQRNSLCNRAFRQKLRDQCRMLYDWRKVKLHNDFRQNLAERGWNENGK